jgi:alpha/beta superfamily hydrolase
MIEETLRFTSDGLNLEARLSYADEASAPSAGVLICPPHPFLGGDLDNNVIAALNRALAAAGVPVFRFNYRGIGESESTRDLTGDLQEFWEASSCPVYEAEIVVDSASAFAEFERLIASPLPLYVIGYSFGTVPAMKIAQSARVEKLCLISPPLVQWSLDMPDRDLSFGVFYAPGDFACPESDLNALFAALPEPKLLQTFNDADHFFVGHESELADAVCTFLVHE